MCRSNLGRHCESTGVRDDFGQDYDYYDYVSRQKFLSLLLVRSEAKDFLLLCNMTQNIPMSIHLQHESIVIGHTHYATVTPIMPIDKYHVTK